MTTTIAFYTLGCKVNQAETDTMADEFRRSGLTCVPFDTQADVYVVNTCTVTHVGDAKSRQLLRQAQRSNPKALVIATGCYASIVRDQMPVDNVLVLRNRDKDRLVPLVMQRLNLATNHPVTDKQAWQGLASPTPTARTRAMVKAQDGCDSACTYCIIPRARGRSRSTAPEKIIERVRSLSSSGYKEVVVTGVDLGSYGDDTPSYPDLGGLLRMILDLTPIHRIRVSSVEPGDFKLEWLDLWRDSRLCRHLHVPLQAGSDSVLARMRRKYTTREFMDMLNTCRSAIPELAVTTDIITGFPGETEAEFENGMSFISQCGFDGMHVFPYSLRSGTAAAHLPDHVPEPTKKARGAILREFAAAGKEQHIVRSIGTTVEIIWEDERDGIWRGLSDTNVRAFAADACLASNRVDVRLLTVPYRDGCWAEPVITRADIPLQVIA